MDNRLSIKSAIIESLNNILSLDKALRDSGEEKLKVLEVTESAYALSPYSVNLC